MGYLEAYIQTRFLQIIVFFLQIIIIFFSVLVLELRALHLLGRPLEPCLPHQVVIFEIIKYQKSIRKTQLSI
jgi:hypothetical protein